MADARSLQSIELKKITEKFTKPLSSPESVKAVLGEVGVYLWWKGFEEKVSHSGKDLWNWLIKDELDGANKMNQEIV